ncbi:MAG: zinc ribbon domain-containing protein [Xanthomonadales bacterium]|nr:zinc ribbon domain-containing protein [Xanthomonadales bacterium]
MTQNRFCESCGAPWVPGARFCERCGAPLAAPAPPSATIAPLPPEPEPLPAAHPAPASTATSSSHASRLGVLALVIAVAATGLVLWPRASEVPPAPMSANAPTQLDSAVAQPAVQPSRAPVTRLTIEALKSAVQAAHRAEVASILAGGESSLEQRSAFNDALAELGQGLYRHHVEDGNGDLQTAQSEMRDFLESLDDSGLGLSEPVIDLGVASVAP